MLLSVPATSANLGPGFDTLGLALGLYNTCNIVASKLSSIHISGEGMNRPKLKIENPFVRIFNDILQAHNYPQTHFKFTLHNKIPISRGLGSSSAVVIGAIVSAYHIMQKPIDKSLILNLALKYEKHPDNIAPALYGGFNVAMLNKPNTKAKSSKTPQTQTVTSIKAPIPSDIRAVVLIPSLSISTKRSRRTLPKTYSHTDAIFNISRSSMLTAAFLSHKWELLKQASEDRFHQEMRMKQLPLLFGVQKTALANGALMSVLSGSGSSFLNICYADDSRKIARILQTRFSKCRVLELAFDNLGANVCES